MLQSDDPARDFRGAGLYGLDNLIYMGTHHPALFKQLMLKSQASLCAHIHRPGSQQLRLLRHRSCCSVAGGQQPLYFAWQELEVEVQHDCVLPA